MTQPTTKQESGKRHGRAVIVVRSILFLLILFGTYRCVNYILRDKAECFQTASLIQEKKNSLDVVFLGSSQIVTSVYPMQLWNEYGIASYNMAASGTTIPQSYYMTETVFEKQKPKVIVADVGFIYVSDLILGNPRFHAVFDNFDFSPTKYRAINALIPKNDRFEMIFPIIMYHTRWNSLTETDLKPITDHSAKGAAVLGTDRKVYDNNFNFQITEKRQEITKTASEYINKLISLCDKNGTKLVLTAIPICEFSPVPGYISMLNTVQDIADEHGLTFLNGYRDENHWGFDYHTDFIDPAHSNARGGEKVTAYLGKFLSSNFNLPDRRKDPAYSDWFKEYEKYKEYYNSIVVYPTYDTKTGISFVTDGYNANSYFVNGIHGCENSWSWSSGKQSDSYFYYNKTTAEPSTISIEYLMTYKYDKPYQDVDVYLNDINLGSLQMIKPTGTVSLAVPKGLMKTEGLNHLLIKYPQIVKDTADGALAVAYQHIYFK